MKASLALSGTVVEPQVVSAEGMVVELERVGPAALLLSPNELGQKGLGSVVFSQ